MNLIINAYQYPVMIIYEFNATSLLVFVRIQLNIKTFQEYLYII